MARLKYATVDFLFSIPTTDSFVEVYLRMYPRVSCLAWLSWRLPPPPPSPTPFPCVQHMAIVMEGKRK